MKDEKGFTLIEAMVALTIFAFVISTALLVYTNGYASYAKNNYKIEVQESLRIALNKMTRDIRQAEEVTVCKQDGSPSPDNKGTGIKIKKGSGKIIEYSYDRKDREVEVTTGGNPQPVVSYIESLEFQCDTEDGKSKVVTIIIKGKKENTNPPVVIELSTKVYPRAL